jgi:hypothetical protein
MPRHVAEVLIDVRPSVRRDGLAIITYIKDARNLPWQKTSRDLSSTGAESNEFLLRVATGTSFLTIRVEDCERFELTVP